MLEIHLNTGKCGKCVVCRYQVVFVTTETRNWELNVGVGSNANYRRSCLTNCQTLLISDVTLDYKTVRV